MVLVMHNCRTIINDDDPAVSAKPAAHIHATFKILFYRQGFVPDKDFRNSSVVDLVS